MKEQIVFNGHKYNRYPAASKSNHRHYYGRAGGFLLHREIWAAANGPIPYGFIVHHKDGNWLNNLLENLEVVDVATHAARHSIEAFIRNTSPKQLAHLASIRSKATEWHRSEEGRAWHRKNAQSQTNRGVPFSKAVSFSRTCCICGTEFTTNNKKRVYCANKCACIASRRQQKLTNT